MEESTVKEITFLNSYNTRIFPFKNNPKIYASYMTSRFFGLFRNGKSHHVAELRI